MAEIFHFVPRAECDAIENLKGFIEGCRYQLTVFGADLEWESNDWDISEFIVKRGRRGRLAFVFSNHDTAGPTGERLPMAPPFIDFAKAYMRYQHGLKHKSNYAGYLAALRALEKALTDLSFDGVPRVEKTDPHALNYAVRLIELKTPGSAYQVANALKIIGEFLVKKQLTAFSFSWKNPVKKPEDTNIVVGKRAEARRKAKMPSRESLEALAQAFRTATEPIDIITTSIAALMISSPDRINEIFRLPVNCVHRWFEDGEDRFGIRWWSSKGAEPMIKPIIRTMVEAAELAIEKLTATTEEARKVALWYEQHPGELYLPKRFEHFRQQEFLNTTQMTELIGFSVSGKASRWAQENGLEFFMEDRPRNGIGRPGHKYRFKDVERVILSFLPSSTIYDQETGLKYSDALILLLKNQFHPDRATYNVMFETLSTDSFNDQLGSGMKHGKASVFSRLGLADADGNPFKMTSHQFRHYLNTLAQKKNIDQLTIAYWSSRKDIKQNSAYDHRTPEDMLTLLKDADISSSADELVEFIPNTPMTREEFIKLRYPTVHTTPYGFCVHDWLMLPCQKHLACLDCTEHKCIKGDVKKTERVRQCLEDAEEQLLRDEQAFAEGIIGVDKWLDLNRKRVERLRNLVHIFDDPTIPEGEIIELNVEDEYSPIGLAINERQLLGDADGMILRNVRSLKEPTISISA